jgi:hypothetical protein
MALHRQPVTGYVLRFYGTILVRSHAGVWVHRLSRYTPQLAHGGDLLGPTTSMNNGEWAGTPVTAVSNRGRS